MWSREVTVALLLTCASTLGWPQGTAAGEFSGAMRGRAPDVASEASAQDAEKLAPRALARQALAFTVHVRAGLAYGTGALLDAHGHVLTCRHVIEDAKQITVAFADGAVFDARLVDSDEELDIALLSIGSTRRPVLTPATIGSVETGDELFTLGAPRNMPFSLSRGMASYVGRPFGRTFYLQTDLPFNAGNSGGPVLNDRGEVVAIASFVLRNSEGIAFALPIDYAYRRFARALVAPKDLVAGDTFERWLAAPERSGDRAAERH